MCWRGHEPEFYVGDFLILRSLACLIIGRREC
jgi:hypothetical protein